MNILIELDQTDIGDLLLSGEYNLFKAASEDHPEIVLKIKLKQYPTEQELVGVMKR